MLKEFGYLDFAITGDFYFIFAFVCIFQIIYNKLIFAIKILLATYWGRLYSHNEKYSYNTIMENVLSQNTFIKHLLLDTKIPRTIVSR